jgi:hypothetical protein
MEGRMTIYPFRLIAASAAMAVGLAVAGGAAAFDARTPADVAQVIAANGASAALKADDKGAPYIDAKAGALTFTVDFYSCDATKTHCGVTVYTTGWNLTSVNVDQINRWNRWTLLCPTYLNSAGHPHAWYGIKPSANDTQDDVKAQDDAWLSCLSDFDKFTDNPEAFLKAQDE